MTLRRPSVAYRLRPMLRATGLVVVLLAAAASAWPLSIREMRALEKSDPKHGATYLQYYLIGAVEGAIEAHSQATRAGAKPQFCLNGRAPEPRRAKALVDAELRRNPGVYEADMPVELVVMNALVNSYPC